MTQANGKVDPEIENKVTWNIHTKFWTFTWNMEFINNCNKKQVRCIFPYQGALFPFSTLKKLKLIILCSSLCLENEERHQSKLSFGSRQLISELYWLHVVKFHQQINKETLKPKIQVPLPKFKEFIHIFLNIKINIRALVPGTVITESLKKKIFVLFTSFTHKWM